MPPQVSHLLVTATVVFITVHLHQPANKGSQGRSMGGGVSAFSRIEDEHFESNIVECYYTAQEEMCVKRVRVCVCVSSLLLFLQVA